eukprot:2020477-Ditylum_brightwellii.AAC.1
MRTVPTTTRQSNPDVKEVVIMFPRPAPRQLEHGQFHAPTSPIYVLSVPFFDSGTPEECIKL